jgi:GAF domain-containing protein/anti-sigma regulatory factor (Ser/Thr protein kinase)
MNKMTALKSANPERSSKLLAAAARISKAVSSILDPDELMDWAVDIICADLGYHYAGIFLVDDTGQWAVLRSAYGEAGRQMIANGYKLAVGGNSMVGLVTHLREERVAPNVDEEADFARNPHLHLPDTHSEAVFPLAVGDNLVGALSVQSKAVDAFTTEDVSILLSLGDQLAVAVNNSQLNRQNQDLLRKSERRARLFQAANEVGKRVASILDLNDLLPKTVDIICEAYGFYYAGVFLIDASGQWAALRAGYGEAGRQMIAQGHKLAVGGHSMIGMATSLREARIALDVGEERVHFKNPFLPNTRSEMALPLAVGDKVLGAVTVQSIEERAFSQDDIMTLQTMADHLAVAIHNAQLIRELERTNSELLRVKTFEALATATTQAIHWIGNKALPITTTIARMKDDLDADPLNRTSLREDLDLVDESAHLIVEVKENLLGPAREEMPRAAQVADVAQTAAFHAGVPAEKLSITSVAGTPMALVDSTQLARALGNLFRNALEAKANQIAVSIAPTADPQYLSIKIADNGEGISPEMMDKIWAAFITTKGPSHAGLGLPACLHVITQLHGRITATSQPGQGSTFTILLPVAPESDAAPADFRRAPAKILLIDDDDAWANFAISTLTTAGKQIVRRTTTEGAADVDLILIDEALVAAPVVSILTALKVAKLAWKAVVVSAVANVERTTTYMQAGVKDVVLKPYTAVELAELLVK